MARQVLPVVGAIVGGYFGGAAGAQWGWAIGSAVGNAVDPQIIQGPKIGDLAQQTSQEGVPRPIVFGMSPPVAGNIIETSEPRIVKKKSGGGKGGPKVETESVFRTYAIRVCEGPIFGFVRVWRNGILVYDARLGNTPDNIKFVSRARFFLGDFAQNPSPDLEAIFGVGTTPAHRGTAYMVMADDDLTDMRGSIPQYAFQVTSGGALDCEDTISYSNEVMFPWIQGVDPRNCLNDHVYEYLAGPERDTFAEAISDAEANLGHALLPDLIGWSRVPGGAVNPYIPGVNSDNDDSLQLHLNAWHSDGMFLGMPAPTSGGIGFGYKDTCGTAFLNIGESFGTKFWWTGKNQDYPDTNSITGDFTEAGIWQLHEYCGGVIYHPPIDSIAVLAANDCTEFPNTCNGSFPAISLVVDTQFRVRRIPRAPDPPCFPTCGTQPPDFEGLPGGYCVVNGLAISKDDDWVKDEAHTWHVLQQYSVDSVDGFLKVTLPLNPALPSTHADYNNQPFWEAAYADAVTAGDMPDGLSYGVDYPVSQSFGYVLESQSCSLSSEAMPLAQVVSTICTRAGLPNIDVSELDADVRGFVITNAYPAYAALQALSQIFLFDPSNYDGVIHFIPRGGNSVGAITEDNMLDDDEQIEQEKRADSISIPRVLNLNYYDVDGGLSTDKQTSERADDRRSIADMSIQTTVLMNADEAARAIHINHKVLIEDQKGELHFSLPDSFLSLTAANPIIVQYQGRSQRARISQCNICDGYQEYICIRDRQSAYTSNVEGIPAAPQTPPPSGVIGQTLIELLDIPTLRDVDDSIGLGYYVALTGLLPAWNGALVELSYDAGANYIDSGSSSTQALLGETVSQLADHPQAYPDSVHSVVIRIDTPDGELEETDLTGLLNGQNLAIIGDELIQFANAEQDTSGNWTLSYLLRGRKDSDPVHHSSGERFVLLDRPSLAFVPANITDIGRVLTFRATSFGTSVDSGTVVSMTYVGRSQTERHASYLMAHLAGDDAIITWQGVGRLGSGAHSAQGAYFIGYRVVITDGSITDTIDTLAETLTHDISAFSAPITVSVAQRNQLTGAGPSIEVTLP